MSFMYFLAVLIGPLVKILYSFIGNYAATMIVATLILKLLLVPPEHPSAEVHGQDVRVPAADHRDPAEVQEPTPRSSRRS